MTSNPELELAHNFVEKTDRNIFLTGKAGAGKTTFLHDLVAKSFKRLIVVAPTGVAAINAKGVTIHSFFQMPFGPILPDGAQTQNTDSRFQRKFNKTKIDIIKSLDLLIIDEISMVRADLLDGIDQVLRRYKNRNKVFGGVQVLMIGDLQQLSPVVKDNEWALLKPYYNTPYFFSSKVFQSCNAISIELKHIYRQDNEAFIQILNEIRNNQLTSQSAEALNKQYLPEFVPKKADGFITLTTHNNRANAMNTLELDKLKSKSFFYAAEVDGKFPEYAYPTHDNLELKKGAQVMFVKNDSALEKRYFNGKIGEIVYLDAHEVIVRCKGDNEDIVVTPEVWENISYSINAETKEISEHVAGSFSQIPLRLAWAITIHKSQGLTFEKAIIDAQASFAHGQTYVALSRCRTLEGIVLKSPIYENNIINDNRVTSFNKKVEDNLPDTTILNESQKNYQLNLIDELFNYYAFLYPINRLIDVFYKNEASIKGNMLTPLNTIKDQGVTKLLKVKTSFIAQLKSLSTEVVLLEKDEVIQDRIKKALAYFLKHTEDFVKGPLETFTYATENKDINKDIKRQLDSIEEKLSEKLYCLNGLKAHYTAAKYIELRAKAALQKTKTTAVKKDYKDTTEHPIVFTKLRELRAFRADLEDVPHFQIFTQKSLYEMCETLPVTKKQLLKVNGMGKIRVKKYGDDILDIIKDYTGNHSIESKEDEPEKPEIKKENTKDVSLKLFKSGLSIFEIAKERGFVSSTIEGHLAHFIPTGEIKITDIMPEEKYVELKKIMKSATFENLTDLKNQIDEKFTYSEMRLVAKELES
tara:strand:+ start:798 stop:3227 length:2430 start_codon:yes stop_codon:yes gene_type:complete